jgi:hypothetical protein
MCTMVYLIVTWRCRLDVFICRCMDMYRVGLHCASTVLGAVGTAGTVGAIAIHRHLGGYPGGLGGLRL